MSLNKQDDNRYQLSVAINTRLKKELEKIHQEQDNDKNWSDAVRMILWMGIKHYYLFAKSKNKRVKGEAMNIDRLTNDRDQEQDRQSEAGIYISKL